MSRLGLIVASVMLSGIAAAQPGSEPYAPPAEPPQQPPPYAPPPQPYAPPAYGYQPPQPAQLTPEEARILQQGPISDGAHIGGGVVAMFFGLGIGQAIQGRWSDTGWIFTLGETASMGLFMYGMVQVMLCFEGCDGVSGDQATERGVWALGIGAIAVTGFRIWGTIDAFTGPATHNRRYRELQWRLGAPQGYPPAPRYGLYLSPTLDRRASVAGLSLRF